MWGLNPSRLVSASLGEISKIAASARDYSSEVDRESGHVGASSLILAKVIRRRFPVVHIDSSGRVETRERTSMSEGRTGSSLSATQLFPSEHPDRFDEWLHAPAALESTHPEFDIRRAASSEFVRIYDLVDETFGIKRPRTQYDWMYLRNPYGRARCWVTFHRGSGRLIGSWASWPWPMAWGTRWIEGCQDGDWVVAKGWQRFGIGDLCADTLKSHAWQSSTVRLAWPNEKTRALAAKLGHGSEIIGPLPKAVLILNAKAYFSQLQWPRIVGMLGAKGVETALSTWSRVMLRNGGDMKTEQVQRFESNVDKVTERCMSWPGLWSPHAADFLNWRYFDHPKSQHLAFAVLHDDEIAGYYVLKIEGPASWLMEFVAPDAPRRFATALATHLISTGRAAGCSHVQFSAPPGWRNWNTLRAAGFLPVPSQTYLWPWPISSGPEVGKLTNWQCVPGDMDFL